MDSAWAAAAEAPGGSLAPGDREALGHREIDRALRRIAKTRAGLDAEEAQWLRRAEALCVWRKLGFSTGLEYLEDVFGYAPRTAFERLRVAKALGELPALDASLRDGLLSYSAARELSRVATPATEARWLERARGRNQRDIEDLVAGHERGDGPDDPKNPDLVKSRIGFELGPAMQALLRQTRAALSDECGAALDDEALFEILCRRALEGGVIDPGKPARSVHMTTCRACKRTWQDGAGQRIEVAEVDRELAACDAQVFDDERGQRATQTIPPATRRKVWQRDQGRCRVPGCRAARNLDVHHLVHRAHGGDHDPSNLLVACSGHHQLLHAGVLRITGRAPDHLVFERDGEPLVDPRAPAVTAADAALRAVAATESRTARRSRFDDIERNTLAKRALQQAGYKATTAKAAVEAACAHVGGAADLKTLIAEALRRCLI